MKFVNFLNIGLILSILLFLNVCKQYFHLSQVRVSQKVKGVLM